MNKYAVISTITALEPIPDADRIEQALVLGWHVIVRKGLYSVGEQIVMVFPDTLVPKKYLDETFEGEDKVRLKTIKMRGHYSAGLILPIKAVLPNGEYVDEQEVSSLLGIEKYEAPISAQLAGIVKGAFPVDVINKTDEDNYRSSPRAIRELKDARFNNEDLVVTLKCDGSSGTYIYRHEPEFTCENNMRVCSRNLELKKDYNNSFWKIVEKYGLDKAIQASGRDLAIQGEVCGPGIQKNPMKLTELALYVFLMKDLRTDKWLSWDETKELCISWGVPHVPEITRFSVASIMDALGQPSLAHLQELANNTKYDSGRTNAEGLVVRTNNPMYSNALQKSWWSLKVMNEPYDMKK